MAKATSDEAGCLLLVIVVLVWFGACQVEKLVDLHVEEHKARMKDCPK